MTLLTKKIAGISGLALIAGLAFSAYVLIGQTDSLKAEEENPIAATVNGTDIYVSEVQNLYDNLPAQYQQIPFDAIYSELLDQVIRQDLIMSEADAVNMDENPEVIEQMAFVHDQVVMDVFIREHVESLLTDDVLRQAYDDFLAANPSNGDEVHARHILVETEEEAIDLIAQLDDGADFAELAKEHSTGPSGESGGDLGFFTADVMVPEFSEAAFELEVGSYTAVPVKTDFGYHVILVEDRRSQEPPAFEDVKDDLREQMMPLKAEEYLSSLTEEADITRYNSDGTEITETPEDTNNQTDE